MTTEPPKRRRWFQFRLRTLLIAVLVLSLPLSWFGVRLERVREERKAVKMIVHSGGAVMYAPTDESVPKWLCEVLGTDFFFHVNIVSVPSNFGDNEAACLRGVPYVKELYLDGTEIKDDGLKHLKGLTNLNYLSLSSMQITDAGLEHLQAITSLEYLYLADSQITDVGLGRLQGMVNLWGLDLSRTQVTDAGLERLRVLTNLESLQLVDTQVTPEGVKKLQEALPNCWIEYTPEPSSR